MIIFLSVLVLLLGAATYFSAKYMLKFANIIMMLEDDLSDASETHRRASEALQNFSELQIYTDSPEIAKKLQQCREELQMGSIEIDKLATTLTSRSKQKYIRFEETSSSPSS
jgi:hypothetical protein